MTFFENIYFSVASNCQRLLKSHFIVILSVSEGSYALRKQDSSVAMLLQNDRERRAFGMTFFENMYFY